MTRLPQVLVNVPVGRPPPKWPPPSPRTSPRRMVLGTTGRVLVRASGTEPLVRIMVEAATHEQADGIAHGLAAAVARLATAHDQ